MGYPVMISLDKIDDHLDKIEGLVANIDDHWSATAKAVVEESQKIRKLVKEAR